jgi:hypothetical protein
MESRVNTQFLSIAVHDWASHSFLQVFPKLRSGNQTSTYSKSFSDIKAGQCVLSLQYQLAIAKRRL